MCRFAICRAKCSPPISVAPMADDHEHRLTALYVAIALALVVLIFLPEIIDWIIGLN